MKAINIQKRKPVQNLFEFALGNGKRLQFTNKRYALRFIADTNRYLTKCLVILNDTYIDIFSEYRAFWFVSSNTNSGTRTNYRDQLQRIKNSIDGAEFVFEKFNNATWGSNDPFFAFIDLRKIATFLHDAAGILAAHHKKRNTTAAYYSCLVLSERCLLVIDRLNAYDYKKPGQE